MVVCEGGAYYFMYADDDVESVCDIWKRKYRRILLYKFFCFLHYLKCSRVGKCPPLS